MKFRAKVIPSGNATGLEIPADAVNALGFAPPPLIAVTVNGHTWRSRVALTRGLTTIGGTCAEMIQALIGPTGFVVGTIDIESERVNAFSRKR